MKHKMLIVDDESANLRMLERLFRADFDVLTATSGPEGLEVMSRFDVAIIISDQRMPEMTGIEFLKKAAQIRHQTVRIVLTGYTDVGDLVEAINSGVVYKYITKPWVNTDLQQNVQRAVEYYETNRKQHLLEQENERLENRIKKTVQGFLNAVKTMIAQKNSKLAEHCQRTAEYAALIGMQLNLKPDEMDQLCFASLLHEGPNVRIPFKMDLNKMALTAEQYRATQGNYEIGLRLISSVPDLEEAATIIRFQHEHFDGTGFFDGLDGERIPLYSRILAVANAFDEINSDPNPSLLYKDKAAADSLRRRAGNDLDPRIVEACLKTRILEPKGFPDTARLSEPNRSIVAAGL